MSGNHAVQALSRLKSDQTGGLSVFGIVMFPAIIMAMGVAIDLTSLNAQKRHVQAVADLSALSAIRNFDTADLSRLAATTTNSVPGRWPFPVLPLPDARIVVGKLDEKHRFVPAIDQSKLDAMNAIRVTATARPRFFVLGAFMPDARLRIERQATAALRPRVSFALSNCLLSLNLFRDMLRPLLSGNLDALCSGHGLRLRGFEFLGAVAANADILQPGHTTYGDVLDAQIEASTIIGTALRQKVTGLAGTVRLGDLIQIDEGLRRTVIGSPVHEVDLAVADIVFGSAEILAQRVVDANLRLKLGGFGEADATFHVSEPRKIVLGAIPGDPDAVARTSQIRLHINGLRIGGQVELALTIDVANAAARLSDGGVPCSTADAQTVALFAPVQADLLQVTVVARALGTKLSASTDARDSDGYRVEPVSRSVAFRYADYVKGDGMTFGPVTEDLTASLREDLRTFILDAVADVLPGGISTGLGQGNAKIDGTFGLVGNPVDKLLNGLLDLKLAEARLDLSDISCAVRLAM